MSERQEPAHQSGGRAADDQTRVQPTARADWRESTTPGVPAVPSDDPYGANSPATPWTSGDRHGPGSTVPEYSTRPVAVRRADTLAGLLLLLSGLAAGISLLPRWLRDDDVTGWDLVRRGLDDAGQGFVEVVRSGFWQPLAIVLGGGVLFLLGLLMFVPGRTHRFLGLLALLVGLLAAAGVLVPLARAGWDMNRFDVGMWFAIAVAGLGLLGALKALLTRPKRGRRPPPA